MIRVVPDAYFTVDLAVTNRIEDTISPLGINILRGVARHRGDDLQTVSDQKISEPFVSRLQENSKIAPVNDCLDVEQAAQSLDEILEIGNHLGSPSGKIHDLNVCASEPFDDPIDSLTLNDLFALRSGVNVAVNACQIAELAEVKLKDLGPATLERQLVMGQRLGKATRVSDEF